MSENQRPNGNIGRYELMRFVVNNRLFERDGGMAAAIQAAALMETFLKQEQEAARVTLPIDGGEQLSVVITGAIPLVVPFEQPPEDLSLEAANEPPPDHVVSLCECPPAPDVVEASSIEAGTEAPEPDAVSLDDVLHDYLWAKAAANEPAPTIQMMADAMGIGVSCVKTALQALERAGRIKIATRGVRRAINAGGVWTRWSGFGPELPLPEDPDDTGDAAEESAAVAEQRPGMIDVPSSLPPRSNLPVPVPDLPVRVESEGPPSPIEFSNYPDAVEAAVTYLRSRDFSVVRDDVGKYRLDGRQTLSASQVIVKANRHRRQAKLPEYMVRG